MKLKLTVNEENIIIPQFDIFSINNDLSDILIAIKNLSEEEENDIVKNIKENKFVIQSCENTIFFITNKKYVFKIQSNIFLKIKNISIDFLDINNIIKHKNDYIISINEN